MWQEGGAPARENRIAAARQAPSETSDWPSQRAPALETEVAFVAVAAFSSVGLGSALPFVSAGVFGPTFLDADGWDELGELGEHIVAVGLSADGTPIRNPFVGQQGWLAGSLLRRASVAWGFRAVRHL